MLKKIYAWEVLHTDKEGTGENPFEPTERFNLMVPGSRCPHCGTEIRFWQNIPVVSYLLQRGRCVGCGTKITVRYLLVEVLCAVLSILVVLKYPDPWQLAFALLLTWGLLALIFIDAEQQILPDVITLPLMWLGIVAACVQGGLFIGLRESVIGAMVGYLSLWSVYWLFRLVTGKEGMGYGDFKLLALLCAWQGIGNVTVYFVLFCIDRNCFCADQPYWLWRSYGFRPLFGDSRMADVYVWWRDRRNNWPFFVR